MPAMRKKTSHFNTITSSSRIRCSILNAELHSQGQKRQKNDSANSVKAVSDVKLKTWM